MAELLKISPTCLYNWEKDKREPTVEAIKLICQILEIDTNWLIGLSDKMEAEKKPTAENDNELSDEEQYLVETYRSMSEQGKKYLLQTAQVAANTYKKAVDTRSDGFQVG